MTATFRSLLGATALVLAFGGAAQALTFTGNFSLSGSAYSNQGLRIQTDVTTGSFSFDLALGRSTTFDLFDIWTTNTKVNNPQTVAKTLLADFTLSGPSAGSGLISGSTKGDKFLGFQWGQVTWNGSVDIAFGTGGVLRLALADTAFNTGWLGLATGRTNGGPVSLTATYVTAPTTPLPAIPVAASGLMLIGGLGGIGILALRRRKAETLDP